MWGQKKSKYHTQMLQQTGEVVVLAVTGVSQPRPTSHTDHASSPLPPSWKRLIQGSRSCLREGLSSQELCGECQRLGLGTAASSGRLRPPTGEAVAAERPAGWQVTGTLQGSNSEAVLKRRGLGRGGKGLFSQVHLPDSVPQCLLQGWTQGLKRKAKTLALS